MLLMVCFQTLERKKRTLLGQKMPFVKGKGRGWSEDTFSSEDGIYNAEQVDICVCVCVCAVKTVNYNEFKLLIAFYY